MQTAKSTLAWRRRVSEGFPFPLALPLLFRGQQGREGRTMGLARATRKPAAASACRTDPQRFQSLGPCLRKYAGWRGLSFSHSLVEETLGARVPCASIALVDNESSSVVIMYTQPYICIHNHICICTYSSRPGTAWLGFRG